MKKPKFMELDVETSTKSKPWIFEVKCPNCEKLAEYRSDELEPLQFRIDCNCSQSVSYNVVKIG